MSERVSMTTNHYFSPKDILGQGATSHVFKGYHRATGEERALKISKFRGESHNQREIQRELNAFLSLRHENIVAFYGIEEEVETGRHVIVMEFCSGGSLYALLQEPEYKYGLDDSEFLVLLEDLKAGLQHMHGRGFIHRDIKPGNILRAQREDGRSVYKLSDFGTCRHDDGDDMGHISLVGTEEYLHPDVYERAFIDRSAYFKFSTAMDTWSLGATLFHASCGEVPFVPFGGSRNNRTVMYDLISKKPVGAVRGFQEKENGPVRWSNDLPQTARISIGLRGRVSVMLANLLERQRAKQWTFQLFFNAVEKLIDSKRIFVLNTQTCHIHTLYMDKSVGLGQVHENIACQTDIPANNQILYHREKQLCELIKPTSNVSTFPETAVDCPLVLIVKNGESSVYDKLLHFDTIQLLSKDDTLLTDVKAAMLMTSRMHVLQEYVTMIMNCQRNMQKFITNFSQYLTHLMNIEEIHLTSIFAITQEKDSRLNLLKEDPYLSDERKQSEDVRTSYQSVLTIKSKAKVLYDATKQKLMEVKKILEKEVSGQAAEEVVKMTCNNCESSMGHVFLEAKKLLKNFKHRSKSRGLNCLQELQITTDRRKMNNLLISCLNKKKSCCQPSACLSTNNFAIWYRRCSYVIRLFHDIRDAVEQLKGLNTRLDSSLITLTAYSNRDSLALLLHPIVRPRIDGQNNTIQLIQNRDVFAGRSSELIQGNREMMKRILMETQRAVSDLDSGISCVIDNDKRHSHSLPNKSDKKTYVTDTNEGESPLDRQNIKLPVPCSEVKPFILNNVSHSPKSYSDSGIVDEQHGYYKPDPMGKQISLAKTAKTSLSDPHLHHLRDFVGNNLS